VRCRTHLRAGAAEELLGERLAGGLIVAEAGNEASSKKLEVLFASHPEPDERGVRAAGKAAELAESTREGDLLLALISGGASALLAHPVPLTELVDPNKLTGDLLRSRADIV
jgi:glycerate 2-kinase